MAPTSALAAALTVTILGCRATTRVPAPLDAVSFTETVRAGEVVGLVLDQTTSRPIQWAMVSLMPNDSAGGSRVSVAAAITDTRGTFRLQAPRQGGYSLLVRYICYRQKQTAVWLDSLAGLAMVIVLTPDRTFDCASGSR